MATPMEKVKADLSAAMSHATPGVDAANELCKACVGILGMDGAAISVVHEGESRGTFGSSGPDSARLDEYQFTFGEGPCLDAARYREAIFVPDLDSPDEQRWPVFTDAALGDGIHAVFALPIMVTSACVGALDLFRTGAGPLHGDQFMQALLVAELASLPLMDLIASITDDQVLGSGGDGWSQVAEMDRIEVYQATGMLISQLDVGAAEALVRLRGHAIATGQTASEVAWAIIDRSLELERDPHHGEGRRPS